MDQLQRLLAIALLVKSSKNARAHKRDIPAQTKHQRVLDYLTRQGIDPEDVAPRESKHFAVEGNRGKVWGESPSFERPFGRLGYKTSASGHQEPIYGDTGGPDVFHEPSFPHAHEAAHLQMLPPGEDPAVYQRQLDDGRFEQKPLPGAPSWANWSGAQEEAANVIENGIWRRAGAGTPITRIVQNKWRVNGREYKRGSEMANERRKHATDLQVADMANARGIQREWDAGVRQFGQGTVVRGDSLDAKINARGMRGGGFGR